MGLKQEVGKYKNGDKGWKELIPKSRKPRKRKIKAQKRNIQVRGIKSRRISIRRIYKTRELKRVKDVEPKNLRTPKVENQTT